MWGRVLVGLVSHRTDLPLWHGICGSRSRGRPGRGAGEARPLPGFRAKPWRKALKSGQEGDCVRWHRRGKRRGTHASAQEHSLGCGARRFHAASLTHTRGSSAAAVAGSQELIPSTSFGGCCPRSSHLGLEGALLGETTGLHTSPFIPSRTAPCCPLTSLLVCSVHLFLQGRALMGRRAPRAGLAGGDVGVSQGETRPVWRNARSDKCGGGCPSRAGTVGWGGRFPERPDWAGRDRQMRG